MAPFDFDEEYGEGDDPEESPESSPSSGAPTASYADQIVANLSQPEEDDELDESYMSKVDERLEVTTHYRILLQGSLFDSDSAAARIVEKEVRRFVRNRVEVLLGIRKEDEPRMPPQVPLPFSEAEVAILKVVAAAAMRSPSLGTKTDAPKAEPQVRRAPAPPPKPIPQVTRRIPKPAPVAKTQPSPASTSPSPPKAAPPAPASPPPAKGGRKRGYIKKTVVNPETGEKVQITKVQQQNPQGRLPWPTEQQMEMLTHQQATQVVTAAASSKVTAELATAALKNPNT